MTLGVLDGVTATLHHNEKGIKGADNIRAHYKDHLSV